MNDFCYQTEQVHCFTEKGWRAKCWHLKLFKISSQEQTKPFGINYYFLSG